MVKPFIAVIAILIVFPLQSLAEQTLSKAQVSELFAGKTVHYRVVSNDLKVVAFFDAGGEARELRGEKRDVHPWWVKDDGKHCIQFKGKKPGCLPVVRRDDGSYVKYRKGKLLVEYNSFEQGNPNNL
ncbi:MAG: hypothetical protein ABW140_05755 [Candidatus Sedimenticola sp. 6PFRAG1]